MKEKGEAVNGAVLCVAVKIFFIVFIKAALRAGIMLLQDLIEILNNNSWRSCL